MKWAKIHLSTKPTFTNSRWNRLAYYAPENGKQWTSSIWLRRLKTWGRVFGMSGKAVSKSWSCICSNGSFNQNSEAWVGSWLSKSNETNSMNCWPIILVWKIKWRLRLNGLNPRAVKRTALETSLTEESFPKECPFRLEDILSESLWSNWYHKEKSVGSTYAKLPPLNSTGSVLITNCSIIEH